MRKDGSALQYAAQELRADRECVLDQNALEFAAQELCTDREFLL